MAKSQHKFLVHKLWMNKLWTGKDAQKFDFTSECFFLFMGNSISIEEDAH